MRRRITVVSKCEKFKEALRPLRVVPEFDIEELKGAGLFQSPRQKPSHASPVLILDPKLFESGELDPLGLKRRVSAKKIFVPWQCPILSEGRNSPELLQSIIEIEGFELLSLDFGLDELIFRLRRVFQALEENESFFVKGPLLSGREKEVLEGLCSGLLSKEIAENLKLSRRTVETHRKNIMGKLKARTSSDLVMRALRLGEIRI